MRQNARLLAAFATCVLMAVGGSDLARSSTSRSSSPRLGHDDPPTRRAAASLFGGLGASDSEASGVGGGGGSGAQDASATPPPPAAVRNASAVGTHGSLEGVWVAADRVSEYTGPRRLTLRYDARTREYTQGTFCGHRVGRFEQRRLFMYGLVGKVSADEETVRWAGGMAWTRVSRAVPPPNPWRKNPSLYPHSGVCPGADGDAYVSSSPSAFLLCTHGESETVSAEFIVHGRWHDCCVIPSLLEMLRVLYPDRRLEAVDVGANVGTCAWVMASEGARVTAFEPVPQNYELLEASGRLNEKHYGSDAVRVVKKAASSTGGSAVAHSEHGNLGNSVVHQEGNKAGAGLLSSRAARFTRAQAINMTTLDAEVGARHVHLMKMDCQGHEIEALLGAGKLLTEGGVDVITTEYDTRFLRASGHPPLKLLEILTELGYAIVEKGALVEPKDFPRFEDTLLPQSDQRRHIETELHAFRKATVPESVWRMYV
eukprot:Rhum_TRINITY_DN13005_c0_g1::Rhum_TRINITY_DN13005_c0_g1_i3::g.56105::m.56105